MPMCLARLCWTAYRSHQRTITTTKQHHHKSATPEYTWEREPSVFRTQDVSIDQDELYKLWRSSSHQSTCLMKCIKVNQDPSSWVCSVTLRKPKQTSIDINRSWDAYLHRQIRLSCVHIHIPGQSLLSQNIFQSSINHFRNWLKLEQATTADYS